MKIESCEKFPAIQYFLKDSFFHMARKKKQLLQYGHAYQLSVPAHMRTIRNDKETKRLDIETIVEKRTFVQNELGLLVSGKSYALP